MNEIDLNQYAAELRELENEAPAEIRMSPVAAIAIISHIQLACRHPETNHFESLNEIAIASAKKIQSLFNPNSATYKLLKMGWNPELDRPIEKT